MTTISNELSNEKTKIVSSVIKSVFKEDLSWENLAAILDEMSSNVTNSKLIITILLQEMKDLHLHTRFLSSQDEKRAIDTENILSDFETNTTEYKDDIKEDKSDKPIVYSSIEGSKTTQNNGIVEIFLSENEDHDRIVEPEQKVLDKFQDIEQIDELFEKEEELVQVDDQNAKEGKNDDIQKIDKEIHKANKKFECPALKRGFSCMNLFMSFQLA